MHGTRADEELSGILAHLEASASLIAERLRRPQGEPERPSPGGPAAERSGDRSAVARLLHAERRRRRTREGEHADLFGDPAWDILLDLYLHATKGCAVTVSSACLASNAPATTGLRWIGVLERRGLVSRTRDWEDRRRTLVRLTAAGTELVERLLPGEA